MDHHTQQQQQQGGGGGGEQEVGGSNLVLSSTQLGSHAQALEHEQEHEQEPDLPSSHNVYPSSPSQQHPHHQHHHHHHQQHSQSTTEPAHILPPYPSNPSDLYAAGLDTLAEAADSNSAALHSAGLAGVGVGVGEYEPFEALHEHFLGGAAGMGGMFGSGVGVGPVGGSTGGKRELEDKRDELLGLRGLPYHFNHHHPPSHHQTPNQNSHSHPHPPSSSSSSNPRGGTTDYPNPTTTQAQELDENGIPLLGGANARIQDDKQRKRIMQACEPCRVRKAKCNGLQPCGRCSERKLDCHFAHERKMRGPNKVKKTAEMKAQHRADRLARQAAKQRDGNGSLLVTPMSVVAAAVAAAGGSEEEEMRATRLVVNAMTNGGLGGDGSAGLTLDAMGRYGGVTGGDHHQDSVSGTPGGTDKQTRNKIGQHLDEMRRGADYLSSFGGAGGVAAGLGGRGGVDSYDRTGQNGGYSFLDPEAGVDDGSAGGFGGYDQSNASNGQPGGEYYSSFSRSDRMDRSGSRDDRSQGHAMSMDARTRQRHLHQQHPGRHVNDPAIDSRLDGGNGNGPDNLDQDSTEAEDRARLAALIDGDPITGHHSHQARYEGENSPGRVNSQGALAAYLLPDGGEEGDAGDFSPGGTEGGVGTGAW